MQSRTQSALKHGWRTFLSSAMEELVCSGQLWEEWLWGSFAVIPGAFSSNSLVNTMDMTAAIQYILTAAQLLGSQVYHKSLE